MGTLIQNGTVVTADRTEKADVLIEEGHDSRGAGGD